MKQLTAQGVTELETKLHQIQVAETLSKVAKENPLPEKMERMVVIVEEVNHAAFNSLSDCLGDIKNLVFWTSLVNSAFLVIAIALLLSK